MALTGADTAREVGDNPTSVQGIVHAAPADADRLNFACVNDALGEQQNQIQPSSNREPAERLGPPDRQDFPVVVARCKFRAHTISIGRYPGFPQRQQRTGARTRQADDPAEGSAAVSLRA